MWMSDNFSCLAQFFAFLGYWAVLSGSLDEGRLIHRGSIFINRRSIKAVVIFFPFILDSVVLFLIHVPYLISKAVMSNLRFRGLCNVVCSYNKSQWDALFLNFILVKNSTCFGQINCPSSGVLILYSQQLVFVILVMLFVSKFRMEFHPDPASRWQHNKYDKYQLLWIQY